MYKRQELKNLAQKYRVAEDIDFVSGISDEELRNLYRKAKVFILTPINYQHYFEGFGLVFLEAAAFGLPIVGTLNNGTEDAVRNGYNGILVPQNNIMRTARAMSQLLQDVARWEVMSKGSLAWASEHDYNKMIAQYIDLYKKNFSTKP